MNAVRGWLLFGLVFAGLIPSMLTAAEPGKRAAIDLSRFPAVQRPVDFRRDVLPILRENCFACHEGRAADSGYRLDVRAEILGETDGRPLAVAGDSGRSRLIHLVSGALDGEIMPPDDAGEPLSAEQVGILRAWIDQGLSWDEALLPPSDDGGDHWAFQPVERPAVPLVTNNDWVRTPVDAFVAAVHEQHGLTPAPPASRRTLIRRATLDLTGLPPSPAQIEAFLADDAPGAYERLIDRLLASPQYGERWARHWLDVARYAESEGYESNHPRPYAWRYRDYVVQSFNADKPYDRFLREQIAGDELSPLRDEHLIATGFLASARLSSNEEDKLLQRNAVLVDIVNATASAVLGLTMGCAQCHNHKFDPLTQRDYYRFQGLFVKGQVNNLVLSDPALWDAYKAVKPPEYDAAWNLRQAMFESARRRLVDERKRRMSPDMLAAYETPDDVRTPEQRELARQADLQLQFTPNRIEAAIGGDDRAFYDRLKKRLAEMERRMADKPQTWGFYSPATAAAEVGVLPMVGFYPLPYEPDELKQTRAYLYVRGDVHDRGPEVEPGWPAVFGPTPPEAVHKNPRLALADWLTGRSHPLTARVWANRVWHYHFGRGLVATPGDFGLAGAPPSHPLLLDWLAAELMERGWSTKHLHRQIMLSSTYRQSSQPREAGLSVDPDNVYLWHWRPRRLEAEAIYDSLLASAGRIDLSLAGPSVPAADRPNKAARPSEQTADAHSAAALHRRALYVEQRRDLFPPVHRLFDGPSANETCSQRHVSTVALQPLYLLNSPLAVRQAEAFAQRVRQEAGDEPRRQIERAFVIALGRPPDEPELAAALDFLTSPSELPAFCQALWNLNEFVYVE